MPDDTTRVVVKGVGRRYDGEYPLDTDRAFNAREWNWIKRISGYLPNTVSEGFLGRDPDLWVAFAMIAMERAGRIGRNDGLIVAEEFAEVPFDGSIQLIFAETPEEDDHPLGLTGEPEQLSPSGSPEKTSSSGDSLENGSVSQEPTPSPTGTSESATSAPRRLPTLSAS